MRIITKRSIVNFYEIRPDSKNQLVLWYNKISKNYFNNCKTVQNFFSDAECIGEKRIVFNIKHNKYRLIAKFDYEHQMVWICFIGTHTEYDKINALSVWNY